MGQNDFESYFTCFNGGFSEQTPDQKENGKEKRGVVAKKSKRETRAIKEKSVEFRNPREILNKNCRILTGT